MTEADLQQLRLAIAVAWRSREHGNHPFGAVLVDENGRVLLDAENTVVTEHDCTGHAETNLVRAASRRYSSEQLARCTLYSSAEPCAMCAGAIHWCGIRRVVYALSEVALNEVTGGHEGTMQLPCRELFAHTFTPVEIEGPALEDEGRAVHAGFWGAGA